MKRFNSFSWVVGLLAVLLTVGAQAQTVEYIHTDALGSIVAVSDAAGNVIERREYEPYGLQLTPTVQDGPGYTGHVQDKATGLTYMQQRYYDPMVGRFLSVDPVTALDNGDMRHFNRYAYAYNNPYKFTDPDGRHSAVAHDKLIERAFEKRLPKSEIAAIQQSSREFDKRTQGVDESHKHSMAREAQPAAEAKSMRDKFIGETMVKARELADGGNRSEALRLFGEAMHPVMDSSSSMHTDAQGNPKEWKGLLSGVGHSPTDWIGNETSKHLTPVIYSSQSKRMNSAYDWVFREGKHKE